ncbi:MAG: anti-sigma factor [Reyranella sp.]
MPRVPIDDSLLVAYVDGELDPVTCRGVDDLLKQNAAVRSRVAMFRRSRDLLRLAFSEAGYMASSERLAVRTGEILQPNVLRRRAWWALPVAAAIAGLVIGNLVLSTNFGFGESSSSRLAYLLEEVGAYYAVFARETEHVVEVSASRRDHIEAWLGNRVRYPFKVPDLTSRGLKFLGARLVPVDGGVVAQLMYVDGGGEHIAICVVFTEDKLDSPLRSVQKAGSKVIGEARGHHAFIVVGPKFNAELEPIAKGLPALLQGGDAANAQKAYAPYGGFARPVQ